MVTPLTKGKKNQTHLNIKYCCQDFSLNHFLKKEDISEIYECVSFLQKSTECDSKTHHQHWAQQKTLLGAAWSWLSFTRSHFLGFLPWTFSQCYSSLAWRDLIIFMRSWSFVSPASHGLSAISFSVCWVNFRLSLCLKQRLVRERLPCAPHEPPSALTQLNTLKLSSRKSNRLLVSERWK